MFCPNCRYEQPDNSTACPGCGMIFKRTEPLSNSEIATGYNFSRQDRQQSNVQQSQQSFAQSPLQDFNQNRSPGWQPHNAQTSYPVRKKRSGCLTIFLIIFIIIAGAGGWFAASLFGVSNPKDLGVRYTWQDYLSAMNKIGTKITFDGLSGDALEQSKKKAAESGIHININDYEWKFSDYTKKSFKLTPEEATALLNEIAPGLWWFSNVQVKAYPDGTMKGSSKAQLGYLKKDIYNDVAEKLPIPVPDRTNLYGEGRIEITNDVLTSKAKKLEIGAVPVPKQYLDKESMEVASPYFERIYKIVPGLKINKLTSDKEGNFVFDGIIPQKVDVILKK